METDTATTRKTVDTAPVTMAMVSRVESSLAVLDSPSSIPVLFLFFSADERGRGRRERGRGREEREREREREREERESVSE